MWTMLSKRLENLEQEISEWKIVNLVPSVVEKLCSEYVEVVGLATQLGVFIDGITSDTGRRIMAIGYTLLVAMQISALTVGGLV